MLRNRVSLASNRSLLSAKSYRQHRPRSSLDLPKLNQQKKTLSEQRAVKHPYFWPVAVDSVKRVFRQR